MSKKISNELKIAILEKKVATLEKTLKEFMDKWGPDVQKRRDERDQVWDEMVRVVSIQKKNRVTRDGDGKLLEFDSSGDL